MGILAGGACRCCLPPVSSIPCLGPSAAARGRHKYLDVPLWGDRQRTGTSAIPLRGRSGPLGPRPTRLDWPGHSNAVHGLLSGRAGKTQPRGTACLADASCICIWPSPARPCTRDGGIVLCYLSRSGIGCRDSPAACSLPCPSHGTRASSPKTCACTQTKEMSCPCCSSMHAFPGRLPPPPRALSSLLAAPPGVSDRMPAPEECPIAAKHSRSLFASRSRHLESRPTHKHKRNRPRPGSCAHS